MFCEANTNRRRTRIRRLWALIVRVLPVLFFAISSSAERLPIKTYTVADGLLRDHINRIRQDSRGFLWFCTGEGLSRFDGVAMTNFTTSDGLPNRITNDFLETRNGTIYIATGKGLARLNPHGLRGSIKNPLFTTFLPDNPKAERIQFLYEDGNNQVWVGTSDGLYKLIEAGEEAVRFEPVALGAPLSNFGGAVYVPSPNTISVTSILETENGAIWIGTFGSGLFRLSPDGAVRRFRADDDGFGDNKITALLEDREGWIWMGLRSDDEGGVCLLDPADDENPIRNCYRRKDGLPSNRIRDLLETSDGVLWLATSGGLCRWQSEGGGKAVCKTYTAKNDLCDEVFVLAEDKDGNLWTGSPCGAKKIARYGFTTYHEADGLDYNRVNAIFENSKGELFVTSFPKTERVVSRFDGEKFSPVKPRLPDWNYHGYGWGQTVWQDSRGAWWIPSGWGLFRSPDNTSFENLAVAPLEMQETGAKGKEAFRLFEDSRGDIWAATTTEGNALLRWERAKNVWHDYSAPAGISMARVGTAFVEDRHGNVWIGASSDYNDGALVRYRNGEFRIFTPTEGAPSNWTADLFVDSRGRLWIATNEDGLLRLDETNADRLEFIKYTPADGLTSITTNCITEDEFGRIYIGTWRGIDRLDPETGQIEHFSNADGIPASYVESAYRDRKNNLWFLTDKGLARFQPEPPRQRKPPPILITGLRVEGLPQSVSILGETELAGLDLNSDQRQISVDFLGLGLSLGEKLKYEYRLNDENWTPTAERTVNFANLSSGLYRFEVRAQSADRIYSEPARLSFKIAAPLWQKWWFIAGVLASTAFLIYAFYRYRLNKLLEIERTRTRIATDLHDDIGANLSKISLLSDIVNMQMTDGSAESRRMLTTIAEVSRSSVASMRDIVWAINPQRDSVLEMTRKMRQYAEETFVPRDISVRFDAPADSVNLKLSMDVRRELFLIFKEAINNAARHSQCSKAGIIFRIAGGEIFLQISDDGRGFDATSSFEGNGLSNMKARAEKIGGRFEIQSARGSGTTIKIKI
jgi:signal transduction histidine kinase/ligand-binding sensor domain-containing protein